MNNKKLKFPSKENKEFISDLRNQVSLYFKTNNISKFGNTSIIIKSLAMGALYLGPYMLMVSGVVTTMPLIILSWIIMGFGMAGLGMVLMHDANHGSYSKNPKVNRWLSKSLYLLGGFPPNWRFQHNTLHHGYTNIDDHDEDIAPVGILRFSPNKPLLKIHRFQHLYAWFFYPLMTLSWVTAKDFTRISKYKKMSATLTKKNNFKRMYVDLVVAKILYYSVFLLIPMLTIPLAWYWIVVLFLVMHFIGGFTLTVIFQTAHVMPSSIFPLPDEQGSMENNWAVHQLLTTTDYAPKSRVFSWFIGGLNYQVVHHLFPNISHVHYKKLSEIVRETTQKYNLPYYVQPTFLDALRQHYNMLKALGRSTPMAVA
ncbi:MAG: fatty acid desaturase family protein [Bacteroidota bacterium]